MLQQVLTDPQWLDKMTGDDYQALSLLQHQHMTPYGLVVLDMRKRSLIEQTARNRFALGAVIPTGRCAECTWGQPPATPWVST
jgi:hypothetical protein